MSAENAAQHFAPEEWRQNKQNDADKGVNFSKQAYSSRVGGSMRGRFSADDTEFHAEGGTYTAANRIAPKPSYLDAKDPAHYAVAMARYKHLHNVAAANSVQKRRSRQRVFSSMVSPRSRPVRLRRTSTSSADTVSIVKRPASSVR